MAVSLGLIRLAVIFAVALLASAGDWTAAVVLTIVLGVLGIGEVRKATSVLDLLDRSTVSFGVAAGVPFGGAVAVREHDGHSFISAFVDGLLGPAGLASLIVLLASFWVRRQLIRKSQRKGWGFS